MKVADHCSSDLDDYYGNGGFEPVGCSRDPIGLSRDFREMVATVLIRFDGEAEARRIVAHADRGTTEYRAGHVEHTALQRSAGLVVESNPEEQNQGER
jgi:hypothetical protein